MSTRVALRSCALLVLFALSGACSQEHASVSTQPVADSAGVKIVFKVDPDPPRAGDNRVEVSVSQGDGKPLADATVTAMFYMPAMPSMGMPEMRSSFLLEPIGGGVYRGKGELVMSGSWDVTVRVERNGERLASGRYTVTAR